MYVPSICFRTNGEPFLSKNPVSNCNCITNSINYQTTYLLYKNMYLEKIRIQNTNLKINSYNMYHACASYGKPRMSKRVFGPICNDIYEFRKTI